MRTQFCLALLSLLMSGEVAFGQGAADRASTQLDTSRAQTESRYNKLGNTPQTETIVREKVITVPAPTPRSAAKSAGFVAERVRPVRTKRVVVRSTETVTKPAPLRINPY
jgi:hypothetical protein